ncbi:MAG: hypothetical protein ACQETH_08545 [Candidatus Rifleibacteriota bacterium]
MYTVKRFLTLFILGMAIIAAPGMTAQQQAWYDATHIFEEDVDKLVKNVKLETKVERAKRVKAPLPEKRNYKVGDVETFWTKNIVENKFEQTKAELKAIGKHCYIFVEQGKSLSDEVFENVRKQFDEVIYPTNTSTFGFEWKPGIDGDERITLLMFDIKDGFDGTGGFVGGYFFAGDQFLNSQIPPSYNIKSNEREMFYLDINPSDPTKDHYMSIVAHEFQHMIHFAHDSKETTWVNEACSQIAPYLCGFGHANQIVSYMKTPDNSLTAWAEDQMVANYGQVYLWNYYIYNRFLANDNSRKDFFKKLVDSKQKGINGYVEAFKALDVTFDEMFERFAVTNFINNPELGKKNEYGYDKSLGRLKLPVSETVKAIPAEIEGEVLFWSADAIKVDLANAKSKVDISFSAPMHSLDASHFNTFSVAVIEKNSRDKVTPKITYIDVKQNASEKIQAGKVTIVPTKEYDTAMIVVIGTAPEEADENIYKKAKAVGYSVSVKDAGQTVSRMVASADANEMVKDYARFAVSDSESNESAMMIRFNNLETISFELSRKVKNDLDAGNLESLDTIIDQASTGKIELESIRPLINKVLGVAEFKANQESDNFELEQRIKTLKSF